MELLASAKMFDFMSLSAERFDLVIIDGPPVIGLADAIVLSKLARSTIFVTTIGHTRHGTLEGAVKRLHTANANIIGAVVNRFDHAGGRYGYGVVVILGWFLTCSDELSGEPFSSVTSSQQSAIIRYYIGVYCFRKVLLQRSI